MIVNVNNLQPLLLGWLNLCNYDEQNVHLVHEKDYNCLNVFRLIPVNSYNIFLYK